MADSALGSLAKWWRREQRSNTGAASDAYRDMPPRARLLRLVAPSARGQAFLEGRLREHRGRMRELEQSGCAADEALAASCVAMASYLELLDDAMTRCGSCAAPTTTFCAVAAVAGAVEAPAATAKAVEAAAAAAAGAAAAAAATTMTTVTAAARLLLLAW